MILISHRGNIDGPNKTLENTPDYILKSLNSCDMCEVDVWITNSEIFLAHDYPSKENRIDRSFLDSNKDRLIIHCKNVEALYYFQLRFAGFHYFWHQNDDYALTSFNWIWAYPDSPVPANSLSIAVLPEMFNTDVSDFAGICSDFITRYR